MPVLIASSLAELEDLAEPRTLLPRTAPVIVIIVTAASVVVVPSIVIAKLATSLIELWSRPANVLSAHVDIVGRARRLEQMFELTSVEPDPAAIRTEIDLDPAARYFSKRSIVDWASHWRTSVLVERRVEAKPM